MPPEGERVEERGPQLARLRVPQLDRLAARGQGHAVRAVRDGPHRTRVAVEGVPRLGWLCRQRRQPKQATPSHVTTSIRTSPRFIARLRPPRPSPVVREQPRSFLPYP